MKTILFKILTEPSNGFTHFYCMQWAPMIVVQLKNTINGDDELAVCVELDDDKWEETMDSLIEPTQEEVESENEEDLLYNYTFSIKTLLHSYI